MRETGSEVRAGTSLFRLGVTALRHEAELIPRGELSAHRKPKMVDAKRDKVFVEIAEERGENEWLYPNSCCACHQSCSC